MSVVNAARPYRWACAECDANGACATHDGAMLALIAHAAVHRDR